LREWHWAFYRAAVITWLAALPASVATPPPDGPGATILWWGQRQVSEDPLYWGSWLALGLIAVETCLNPFCRRAMRTPGLHEHVLRRIGITIATAALFALTRNFWLCAACNVAVETIVARWFPLRAAV
jgi:hypothetical protein